MAIFGTVNEIILYFNEGNVATGFYLFADRYFITPIIIGFARFPDIGGFNPNFV